MSKGSNKRPSYVDIKTYTENFERIFGAVHKPSKPLPNPERAGKGTSETQQSQKPN